MKKALFFIQNGVGGAERVSINIAKMLPANMWEINIVKICSGDNISDTTIDDFIPHNFIIRTLHWKNQLSYLWQLYQAIRASRPDVVFASVFHINMRLMILAPLFPNIKFIIRNNNYLDSLSDKKKKALRYLYNNATAVIAQTDEMENELVAAGVKKRIVCTLHNPIDTSAIDSKAKEDTPFHDEKAIRYVAVGRFNHVKGFDLLAKAFEKVHNLLPQTELWIIGNYMADGGKIKKQIIDIATAGGWEDCLHIHGYTDNPYKFMKNADVFVLSSRKEGLPNVLIEAQYLGVPVAAFKCIPIIERIVKNGYNGFLAEAENVEELADAMKKASELLKPITITYNSAHSSSFLRLFE